MPVSKSEYLSWRNDPLTQEFIEATLIQADVYIANLIMAAGRDPGQDRHHVGMIEGLKWLMDWEPEFEREELKEEDEEDA